ncbi:MAG: glutaredoxin [Bdellovibrionaceae bacterium]|nr:glutaredoxin [Pseudobdellovibrionaceae bacterium]
MRQVLDGTKITPRAQEAIDRFHPIIVSEIQQAIQTNEWVIVGMAHNIPVIKARKFLEEKNISFKYIQHGSYFSKWKARLAIKLWSGWPTFPQVFHKGVLVGGFTDLKVYIKHTKTL